MKNSTLFKLFMLFIFSVACSKDDDNRNSGGGGGGGNNTTSISQYVANWKLSKYEILQNIGPPTGVQNTTQLFNNPASCILFLTSNASASPNYYQATYSFNSCNPISVVWNVTQPGYLEIQLQQFYVEKLTNDSLVISTGDNSSPFTIKQVYHYYK